MPNQKYYGDKYNQGGFKDDKDKTKTEGQRLEESGQYLKDPDTEVDTSQPLESRMFDIDPKKHKTQQKQKKIRNIAEQGATEGEQEAGKRKLKDQTDLPNFLQSTEMGEIYEKDRIENLNKDRAIEASEKAHKAGNISDEEHIQNLLNAPNYITPEQLNDAPMKTTDPFGDLLMLAASNYLVRHPRQVGSFALDLAFPDVEGVKFEQWTRLNPTVHMAVKGTQIAAIKGKQYLSKQKEYWGNVIDYLTDPNMGIKAINSNRAGGLERISAEGIRVDPLYSTFLESRRIDNTSGVSKSNVTNLPPQGMSAKNNKLFKDLGFEDWEKYFVGAWEDLADPISRNFSAAVSNDKYSWNTFDRVRRETLPLVMEEYAGIADIKWPRKGPELHHINAIKATMPLFEGLARNERKELLKVLMREGIYAGHDPNNLMQLPHAVHKSVTKLWNDKIGKSGKLFFERDKDGLFKAAQLPFEERKILAKNYAQVVKDLELTTLKMATDYKAVSKDGLSRKLDKELKTQFNIANFENFILTGKYLGDGVSPEVKQIFKSRSVKNIRKRTKK